jgi:hypothetical protein
MSCTLGLILILYFPWPTPTCLSPIGKVLQQIHLIIAPHDPFCVDLIYQNPFVVEKVLPLPIVGPNIFCWEIIWNSKKIVHINCDGNSRDTLKRCISRIFKEISQVSSKCRDKNWSPTLKSKPLRLKLMVISTNIMTFKLKWSEDIYIYDLYKVYNHWSRSSYNLCP